MNILFVGDVFGKPGREALLRWLPGFTEENAVDFVIANGENAANGAGITSRSPAAAASGVDVITTGITCGAKGSVSIPGADGASSGGQLPAGGASRGLTVRPAAGVEVA
jgi:hypothetical protein